MRPSTPSNTFSSEPGAKVYWPALLEALLFLSLILLYIWRLRFIMPWLWMVILGCILIGHACRRETGKWLGFRWTYFTRCLAEYSPLLAFAGLLLSTLGVIFQTIRAVSWESACASLIFYCFWGLFQQYLLNGYFVNRFVAFFGKSASNAVATLAALFFAMVHQPNWFLVIITFIGGYLAAKAYLKHRNLYFLGLAHGFLGFFVYLTVPDSISHHLYVGPKWFREF